nr:MAG TPA: hypothetical protein [Caudoviricetes sp.]
MKQQILEVLDKSTNNGMKADEIMEIVRKWTVDNLNDVLYDDKDGDISAPAFLDDIKIFMIGRLR